MQKLIRKCRETSVKAYLKTKNFLSNTDGDQITGWLIVILLVVLVGAWGVKTWFMILLAAACIGICIACIAAIVIDICNIIYLIQEIRRLNKEKQKA